MSKMYDNILERIEQYVTGLFERVLRPELVYHNLAHTQEVVKRAEEIGTFCSISNKDMFIVTVAAWFHDCGHIFGPLAGHEERSVMVMKTFLSSIEVEENIWQSVEKCIMATKFPYNPENLLAEIICDADSYHLGTHHFLVSDDLVKKEFEQRDGADTSDWDKSTLSMLEHHHFFTDYCKAILNEGKQRNIDLVRSRLANNNA